MLVRIAGCALVVSFAAAGQSAPRYDLLQQKSSHNAYAREESLFDQLVFHRIRSIELDIWQSDGWAVRHNGSARERTKSNCSPLESCLAMVAAFHEATPQHEVVTVWLEPSDYSKNKSVYRLFPSKSLDQVLISSLGRDALFTPRDLARADCQRPKSASLEAQVAACGFPSTDALRGKVIFVLMDANEGETDALTQYLGSGAPTERAAFVGPDPSRPLICNGCAVFHNLNGGVQRANPDFGKGAVSRSCCAAAGRDCSAEGSAEWANELGANTQHAGTNCINYQASPWAITHNKHGWPFRCLAQECESETELNDLIGLLVHSGDLDGNADDFGFAYEEVPEGQAAWKMDADISSAGSRVDAWEKGCLMARAQLVPESPYFAVCRPDRHRLRIQYRAAAGAGTTALESDVSPVSNAPVVHLEASFDGQQTCFTGAVASAHPPFFSRSVCIPGRFPLRGLAASSHGDPAAQLLFARVTLTLGDRSWSYPNKANLPGSAYIGKSEGGSSLTFDGPFPGAR